MARTTITVDGIEENAYRLIMRKENAIEILKGNKQLEIRAFNAYYEKMFVNKDILAKNDEEEFECPIRDDVWYIRFTNYNESWFLDVQIDESAIGDLSEESIQELRDDFNFHEMDDEVEKYKGKPEDEIPMFFWFKMGKIIGTNLKI